MTDKQDRAWAEYAEEFRRDIFPHLVESAMFVQVQNGGPDDMPDVRAATQLGMAILLGKPILLLRTPGAHVPDALAQLALNDQPLDWDPESHDAQKTLAALIRTHIPPE